MKPMAALSVFRDTSFSLLRSFTSDLYPQVVYSKISGYLWQLIRNRLFSKQIIYLHSFKASTQPGIKRKMKKPAIIFLLFLLQLYLTFDGIRLFGKYGNPFVLFVISLSIAALYFKSILDQNDNVRIYQKPAHNYKPIFIVAMTVAFGGIFILYLRLFQLVPHPAVGSDVLPQLEALYDRFAVGEQPYYPLYLGTYSAFPVYMPLHWLPIGFARLLGFDPRLIGLFILFVSIFIYLYWTFSAERPIWENVLIGVMPLVVLLGFRLNAIDLACTFETPIGAYYLMLALGLARRNLYVTAVGIILCVLSRYTLVFWLPLFAVLLWFGTSYKKSLAVWLSLIAAVVFIYIIPFYLRNPAAFLSGIHYHNNAAIGEWIGTGPDSFSGTFECGIYFAPHMKALFHGEMDHRVFCARVVQACVMLLLLGGGLAAYKRLKDRIDFFDYSLGMLYLVILCFYMIGPLTYRYYFLSLFMISMVLCSRVIMKKHNHSNLG